MIMNLPPGFGCVNNRVYTCCHYRCTLKKSQVSCTVSIRGMRPQPHTYLGGNHAQSTHNTTLTFKTHLTLRNRGHCEIPLVEAAPASVLPHHTVDCQICIHQGVMEPPATMQTTHSSRQNPLDSCSHRAFHYLICKNTIALYQRS